MPNQQDDSRVRQQLLEENRRLAQRCLELERTSRQQLEKLQVANATLGHSEVDLRALLDSASVGFALIDLDLRIAGANQALATLLKVPMRELPGGNFGNFVYVGKLPAFNRIVNAQAEKDGKREEIVELVAHDGGLIPCRIVANNWQDEQGAVRGHFLLVFDSGPELQAAKRLRDTETALEETEKSHALFLEVVSRELRTPAASVAGMSRMLLDAGLNDRQAELAGVIHSSAGSLVRLVDDLVDAASPEPANDAPQPKALSPASLARGVVNLFGVRAEEKGLDLRVQAASTVPPRVMADPRLLRRVLTHLMDNSVKFTEHGHITLAVDVVGQNLRFMVSDTGPGIDPSGRDTMFRPGHGKDSAETRRRGGIGVGLAVCRRLVSLMGGRLDCESEPGRGSEFHFTIPLVTAGASSDTTLAMAPPEAVHLPPLTILLADANPMSSQIILAYLNFDGHRLTHTDNGVDAAEKCRGKTFDLVIIDRNLPKLDGLQSLRLIREDERDRAAPRTPVLVMATKGQLRQADQILQAGADGVVAKPVRPVELMRAVAQAAGVKPISVAAPDAPRDYAARSGGGTVRRIDGAQLANLSQIMPEDQFRGMLRFFMEDAVANILELRERALGPHPDRERIAFAASKSGGLAGYLGFTALAEQLKRLENACSEDKPSPGVGELAGELSMIVDDSLEELQRILPDVFATISDLHDKDRPD